MRKLGYVSATLVACVAACSASGGGEGSTEQGASGPDGGGSVGADADGDAGNDADGDAGNDDGPAPADGPLDERITVTTSEVAAGVKAGVSNWRIWGRGSLHVAPVFTVPLDDCGALVCFSSGSGAEVQAHIARLDAGDRVVEEIAAGPFECRGLAAEPGGAFAALLWNDAADEIHIQQFGADGTPGWTTPLVNGNNTPTEFGIGDSRLEYGDGRYAAYYHVHSNDGHEGDTLKFADAATGAEDTGWGWGCSHSMSNLLRYSKGADRFLPACVTDCFPGTSGSFDANSIGGIYLDHDKGHVIDVDAGCNGSVAGELGGAAPSPGGWGLVFNAHQAAATPGQGSYDPASKNQDIGFVTVDPELNSSAVVWLTDTPSLDEADASIARWTPSDDDTDQYVVGWSEPGNAYAYKLARVDPSGAFLEAPVDVTAHAQWGRRDDPFRRTPSGDVIWSWFDAPGSTTLHVARLSSGRTCSP